MSNLRLFSIIAWIALPTVMYGGYALHGLLTRGGLTPFQQTFFRAGHAHAGVLLLLSLVFHSYLEQIALGPAVKAGGSEVPRHQKGKLIPREAEQDGRYTKDEQNGILFCTC